jgi:transposase-like protein
MLAQHEGFMALAVFILSPKAVTPENAFALLSGDPLTIEDRDEITQEMIRLRDSGMMFKDIASLYGTNHDAVYYRIRRYKQREARKDETTKSRRTNFAPVC